LIAGFKILEGFRSTECKELFANRPDKHRSRSVGVPMEFVRKKLSPFKIPDRWTFMKPLSLNTNGKIDSRAL